MLDAVPVIGARLGRQRLLVGIEHHLDAAIADGMDGDLPARRVRVHHISLKDLLAHHRQAEVVRVGIVQEGLRDGGGPPDQAAVDEEFDRAAPQSVIAEARADADRRQVGQQMLAQHQRRAEGIDAALRRPLEGAELRVQYARSRRRCS